jgi:hypothetical protein
MIPSARTLGRAAVGANHEDIRLYMRNIYRRLKRGKGLRSPFQTSLFSLIIDGHECFCSYLRKWKGCLQRRIKTPQGERIQYYCRVVSAVLVCENFVLLLDVEAQRPNEGEVACALRLFKRIMKNYPKAFHLVCTDGLYAQQPFIKLVRMHRKHCVVVLKDERRDLLVQAGRMFGTRPPTSITAQGRVQRRIWDVDVEASWAQSTMTIRVVRSVELSYVRRQLSGEKEAKTSEWVWATTLARSLLPADELIEAGHRRWDIENKCFNELASTWHVNHAYVYDTDAVITFWLLTMTAYNLFHAFYWWNLKKPVRDTNSKKRIALRITAEFYCYEETG